MTSTVKYLGNLRCEATHLASGQTIITDAPLDNKGKGEAFSPTDIFATSLGACALTIMGIAAAAHGINMEGARAEVQKVMSSEPPRRVARIEVLFVMPALNYSEKQQKILQNAAHTCPVSVSLGGSSVEIVEVFQWL